jgi:hypothetical protein
MFKKIILLLILLCVIVVGLQTFTIVDACGHKPMDEGNFKVSERKINYCAIYGENPKTHKINKNELKIDFSFGKIYEKNYLLKKNKKDIKSYIGSYNKKGELEYKHLKTYKTTKNLKLFYTGTYKATVTNQVKSDAKKYFRNF